MGILSIKNGQQEQKEEKPEPKSEPVYYIVEKRRSKKSYSAPKEIKFK